jgi:hypothetical protein
MTAQRDRATRGKPAQSLFASKMSPLILKRAPIGDNQDDYDVLRTACCVR